MRNLLNHTAVRQTILGAVRTERPGWNCTRVSPVAIRMLEAKVRNTIRRAARHHPSRGETFCEIG